jgi:eukaryotic-like serine/threonine-protein kinase
MASADVRCGAVDLNQCPRCKTRFRAELKACPIDGQALEKIQDPLLGRTIAGRYLVEQRIGSGGMGVVYRGRHQAIDRDVAIKFLHDRFTRDPTSRKRFLGEARAANQIDHENIIDITDFGETDDGLVFLVMEYLQGHSLDREILGKPMALERALRIAAQVATGLARAHELDVIHRDVKPANVFLTRKRGEIDFVKLLDFGIAHFERELRITDRGVLMGTPEYMAPEQVRSGEATPSTDLYALGCVLYEMLTGQAPFRGQMPEVLIKQMRELPVAPSRAVQGVPEACDAVVLRLLSKEPNRRHRDAFHLLEDLQALLEQHARSSLPSGARKSLERVTPEPQETRPTIHVPTEQEEWTARVAMYRQILARAYPRGDVPESLHVAMQSLELALATVNKLRTDIDASAVHLTTQEDDVRTTRLRIGRALDELLRDESKLARGLDADKKELGLAENALHTTIKSLVALAQALDTQRPELPRNVHAQLMALAEADTHFSQIQKSLEQKRFAWDDLRFQIAQLKGRLASLNAESTASVGHTQSRVHKIEVELRLGMDRLVSAAEKLAADIRQRPELAKTLYS